MHQFKAIFLSDTHLGSKNCHGLKLLHFLQNTQSEYLFLVGDILDGWSLERKWYWPPLHMQIVQLIIEKAKTTQVIYISGNHDEFLRTHQLGVVCNIKIVNEWNYTNIHNDRILILHGDQFDMIAQKANWLSHVGDYIYTWLIGINKLNNFIRRKAGKPHWSLSRYLKDKTKSIVKVISKFEKLVSEECISRNFNGVVCGHIHHADIIDMDEITYYNDGDWCESCTALVETTDGKMQIITLNDDNNINILKEKAYE